MGKNKKFFYALTIAVSIFFVYFIRRYLVLVSAAAVVVIVFNPIFHRLVKLFKGKKGAATALTITIVMLSIIIPLIIMSILLYSQITMLVTSAQDYINEQSFQGVLNDIVSKINDRLSQYSFISYRLTVAELKTNITNLVGPASNFILNFVRNISGHTASFFTSTIVFIILLGSMFPNQDKILRFFKQLSPLDDKIDTLYITKIRSMAKSMVFGTFVIALVQGIVGGLSLYVTGVPFAFFLTVIFVMLSIIPLGGGIISIPIGLYFLITGDYSSGLIILLTHFLVVTNIDNILRPKLVSNEAKLPEALTLLGVFAGLGLFGPLGVIFGPVVMIFIFTTLEIYIKYYSPKVNAAVEV